MPDFFQQCQELFVGRLNGGNAWFEIFVGRNERGTGTTTTAAAKEKRGTATEDPARIGRQSPVGGWQDQAVAGCRRRPGVDSWRHSARDGEGLQHPQGKQQGRTCQPSKEMNPCGAGRGDSWILLVVGDNEDASRHDDDIGLLPAGWFVWMARSWPHRCAALRCSLVTSLVKRQ